jgi:pilus assembly protein Flp/PilA
VTERTGTWRWARGVVDDAHVAVYLATAPRGAERKKGGIPHMNLVQSWLSSLLHREEGQGLAEYALILSLIAIVAILALLFLGTQISTILSTVGNAV